MKVILHLKKLSYVAAALSAIVATSNTSAAPIYLLLEGTISSRGHIQGSGGAVPPGPSPCIPYVCSYDRDKGQSNTITAIWDNADMFGGNINPSQPKATYASNGRYTPHTTQIDYYPLDGTHVVQTSSSGAQPITLQ